MFSDNGSWLPLLLYLERQAAEGQKVSLTIAGAHEHICRDVVKEIGDSVKELRLVWVADEECPFGICASDEKWNGL